ncbi:MAG: nucleotide sugar dehydrogenase [Myxococcota bacterium]
MENQETAKIEQIIEKIKTRNFTIGVIGVGYVGLPLVLAFTEKGFPVIGFDIDQKKVERINQGNSYIKYIPSEKIAGARTRGLLDATTDFSRITEADAALICVPTPLTEHREPDLSFIVNTAEAIAPHIRESQLFVLESTTYPGTTDEVLIPILEKRSGLKAGQDFFAAYSPEREDPNNKEYTTSTIPKVVGGFTENCLKIASTLYGEVIVKIVPVSSTKVAEASKLLENIFRSVNIAMVNELKIVFQRMGIDIWEVINSAKTKPFGFMPFYPGPGLGGHCIPIDPFYLTWKAREYGIRTRFIELAGEINTSMPRYVVQRVQDVLNEHGKPLKGSKVLLVGLAYKSDVDDTRESPSFALWQLLEERGAKVDYFDPHVPIAPPSRRHKRLSGIQSKRLEDVSDYDLVLIATAHSDIDYDYIAEKAKLVVDTRNVCPQTKNVYRG